MSHAKYSYAKNSRETSKQAGLRKHYYTLLAIGKEQLGFDDEFYRGIWLPQQGATLKDGRYSATTMSLEQLSNAVQTMERCGFKPTAKHKGKKHRHDKEDWRTPRIKKLTAMWLELADKGIITNRSSAALEHWCKKHTAKDSLQWVTSKELNTCIEQMKSWGKRVGVELN